MPDYRYHHVSINTLSLDSAVCFYRHLGFSECYRYSDDSVTIVHLLGGGGIVELFLYSNPPSSRSPTHDAPHSQRVGLDHFSLQVDDVNKAYAELRQFAVCEVKAGRTGIDYFFVKDPDGTLIEIVKDVRTFRTNACERSK